MRLEAALDEEERRVRKGLWCMSGEEWGAMPEQGVNKENKENRLIGLQTVDEEEDS